MHWEYEKLDENYKTIYAPTNDTDGKTTGHIVIGVKAWFDEHPDERIARGWTKHIHYSGKEIREKYPHNPQTQYLEKTTRQVDEHTIEDVYYVMNKTEEQMAMEELLESTSDGITVGRITFTGRGWGDDDYDE